MDEGVKMKSIFHHFFRDFVRKIHNLPDTVCSYTMGTKSSLKRASILILLFFTFLEKQEVNLNAKS